MIFVDANVFMYAVGAPHPLRETAVEFLLNARRNNTPLATSAEVLQEMLHVYSSVGKFEALNEALTLVEAAGVEVWPLEKEDVTLAHQLHALHPTLSARDLCHLASCRRRGVSDLMTFDVSLRGASQSIL